MAGGKNGCSTMLSVAKLKRCGYRSNGECGRVFGARYCGGACGVFWCRLCVSIVVGVRVINT